MSSSNDEDLQFKEILNHLRTSVAVKYALIKKEKIEYVTGTKLVDGLMSSKWSIAESDANPYFKSREDAVKFCQRLLDQQLFVGGQKIEVQQKTKKDEDEGEEETKKKRRFRIEQIKVKKFLDTTEDVYIWVYEPPNRYRYVIGAVLLIGIVAFTLQPLWPESSKYGMWYVSITFMILLGVLILVYIVRWFLWGLVFTVSVGKINFWLLPNLDNEKLGVIDSFKPLYSLKKKKKKTKKESEEKQMSNHDDAKAKED